MEGLGINWKTLIGEIINFFILFFLLKKFVFPLFFKTLKNRRETIENGVKKSQEAEENLQKVRELEKEIKEAGERRARELVQTAQATGEKRRQEILASAEEERTNIVLRAEEDAKKEMESEREKRKKETMDMSFAVAEKFLKGKFDEDKDKKFLEEMISEIKQS
jgi:F-type H+-transporting ATPase subunit b